MDRPLFDWFVYSSDVVLLATTKYIEDAAALVSACGDGTKIVHQPTERTVWVEGAEEIPAGDSYDHVAEVCLRRIKQAAEADNRCECEDDGLVPGVLFPWHSDLDIAGVERCDLCKRFSTDEDAGAALQAALHLNGAVNLDVRPVDKDGHLAMHAIFAGDVGIPLNFEQGEQVDKTMRAKAGRK